jgi:hypothetical protein
MQIGITAIQEHILITICTKNREHYFGEKDNGIMQLSPVGAVAVVLWYEIKNHAQTSN